MAKQTLPTNFQDDILNSSMNGKRRYREIPNADGTISLEDATTYDQVGSNFGASQLNLMSDNINQSFDANKMLKTMDEVNAVTQEGYGVDALVVKQVNNSLTNENGETFRYGYQDGKRGVWVKEADTDVFVPFKSDLVVSDIWQYTETSPNYDTTHNITTDDMSKYSSIILSSSWAWTKYSNTSEVKVIPMSEFKNGQTYRVDNYYNGSITTDGYAEITYMSDTTIALKRGGYSAAFILFVK